MPTALVEFTYTLEGHTLSSTFVSTFQTLVYCFFLGFFVNISLRLSGHRWAKNFSFVLTCLLLPMIAAVIATVISGNIALSLGMVGALSIIRFRHPVKTPFELSVYFLLLTLGITASVSGMTALALVLTTMLAVYFYSLAVNQSRLNRFIPNLEMDELANHYLLEIVCSSELSDRFNDESLLFSYNELTKNVHTYKFAFSSNSAAKALADEIQLSCNGVISKKLTRI